MSANLEVTILGCGSSGGVPRVGGDWGACDPDEPRNRRTRCSLWVEYWETESGPDSRTRIIIDTSPDLREQLLSIDAKRVDAVLFTHEHADQTHGIDDLRALAYRMRNRIPTFMDAPTKAHLWTRFKYCFETPEGRVHPPILELGDQLEPGKTIHVDGPGGCLPIEVVGLSHGPSPSLGFIFDGKIAYTPDVHDIDDTALEALTGLDVWVMDALRYSPHPTHAHADKALSWIARTKTQKAVLTNLHIDMDYASLKDELPGSQDVAYDGMKIQL